MGTLALAADERVAEVEITDDNLIVGLMDGRTISVPLVWYPRLLSATPKQRRNWQLAGGGYGIHWPDIDEDLNTEGLLRGAPAPRPQRSLGSSSLSRDRSGWPRFRRSRNKAAPLVVWRDGRRYGPSFTGVQSADPGATYRSSVRLNWKKKRTNYNWSYPQTRWLAQASIFFS